MGSSSTVEYVRKRDIRMRAAFNCYLLVTCIVAFQRSWLKELTAVRVTCAGEL
jgi:hypothetical protein